LLECLISSLKEFEEIEAEEARTRTMEARELNNLDKQKYIILSIKILVFI